MILNFDKFKLTAEQRRINESDGFGTSPYLLKKVGDVYHYFFNIELEDEESEMSFHLAIGKYSSNQVIDGPKNSYCVLNINQISQETMEDIAVDREDIPEISDSDFSLSGNNIQRLMKYVSKCLVNYLESNPKVSRIYDDFQDNLIFKGEGTYLEFMKSIILSNLGNNWYVQEGSSKKSLLISR